MPGKNAVLSLFDDKKIRHIKERRSTSDSSVFQNSFGFYTQTYFHEMLDLERKRTERSKKSFVLMLIEVDQLPAIRGKKAAPTRIAAMLQSSTRDIDIRGWYEEDRIIGVIFTETGKESCAILRKKMHENLSAMFTAEVASQIQISCSAFPEDREWLEQQGVCADARFYQGAGKPSASRAVALAAKRAIDIVGALCGIVLLSPFFLIIPILIKLDSRGPVLFKQKRVGQGGRVFTFVKYRSMKINNDASAHQKFMQDFIRNSVANGENTPAPFKIMNDPRVTRIGRVLRSSSLDEIPQLFSVLAGTMSLVGPRPPIPYEVREYDIWHRRRVLQAKPGITGLWQVEGRSRTPFPEMCRMDIQYAENWSLATDIRLIAKTPMAVLGARGAC